MGKITFEIGDIVRFNADSIEPSITRITTHPRPALLTIYSIEKHIMTCAYFNQITGLYVMLNLESPDLSFKFLEKLEVNNG
jgi:hypothetical protein